MNGINCLGKDLRLMGHRRVPDPPAITIAYLIVYHLFLKARVFRAIIIFVQSVQGQLDGCNLRFSFSDSAVNTHFLCAIAESLLHALGLLHRCART